MRTRNKNKNREGLKMDFRYNYDTIRSEIERADFGEFIDNESALVKDIKRDMNMKIDIIEEYEKQIDILRGKIKEKRLELMEIATKWDI
jgi:hypothetical protein